MAKRPKTESETYEEDLWHYICCNVHWILVVYSGLYMYVRDFGWLKPILSELKPLPFDPSYSTFIFVFSVMSLVAEYSLYPKSLRPPPYCFFIFYKIAMVALIKDAALRMIWFPLMYCVWTMTQNSSKLLCNINSAYGPRDDSWLFRFADYMGTRTAATHVAFALSLLIYLWMLDATDSIDLLFKDFWAIISQILIVFFHVVVVLLVALFFFSHQIHVKVSCKDDC